MNTQIRILLVEDNPGDARLIKEMLVSAKGLAFDLARVDNLTAAIQRLQENNIDVVLLDLGLSESTGLDTVQRLFVHVPSVPALLVMSGLADEDVAVQAVHSGAQDYLIKGHVDSALLTRAIRYAIERRRTEDAMRQLHAELERRVDIRTVELANAVKALNGEIAERKRAEGQFRGLLESAPDALVIVNQEGKIVLVNTQAEKLFGYQREELLESPVDILVPDRFRERYKNYRAAFFDYPRTRPFNTAGFELGGLRNDGQEFPVDITLSPLQTEERGVLVTSAIRDITDRKRAEEELKRHRDHLEELVKNRTAELTVAKDRAEVANRTKSAFLASMSHELRTPLNAILGYAQILKRDKHLSDRQSVGLNTIQQSGELLLMLITDLLDLSRIEDGKLELYQIAINLPGLLRLVANIVRARANQKGLSFTLDVSPDLPKAVRTDEKRLRQVLLNLLGNAVKFTDRGHITLRVRRLSMGNGTVELRFEVFDTGIGISPDQIKAIFRPFEQVRDSHRRPEGTGLGLTLSRQLIQLMGGDVQVESEPGKGSRFWFDLSLELTAEVPAAPSERIIIGYQGSRKKVLLVDDAEGNRSMLVDQLSPLGFDIMEAANGEEALAQIETMRPDLIIMDMVMPILDGRETTHRIRLRPAFKTIPIIAVSASASKKDQAELLEAGANTFMSKPIEQEQLLQAIGQYLQLNWLYDNDDQKAPYTKEQVIGTPLVAPPYEEMQILYVLALAGNMRDIRQWADHLASLDPQYRSFADKLHQLAQGYQSQAILDMVEEYMRET